MTKNNPSIATLRALHPGVLPAEIALPRAGLVIGRDPNAASLVIRRDGVSRQHCWLGCSGSGRWLVRDLDSRNGVFVNGERISGEQPLQAGDVIGLGRSRLADLELNINGLERRVCLSGSGPWRMGRDLACELSLPADPGVSQHHATLRLHDGQLLLEDNGSRNGTWLNGRRVRRAQLRPGDCLFVAGSRLQLRTLSPAPEFSVAAIEQALALQVTGLATADVPDQGLDFEIEPGRLQALVLSDSKQRRAVLDTLAGISQPIAGKLAWSEPELDRARARLRTRVGRVGERGMPSYKADTAAWLEQQASLAAASDLSAQARRERVAALLAELDASHLATLPLDRLTALEQALALVASELLTNPGLLLIDLPALLDQPGDRADLIDRVQALSGPRLTVVLAMDQPLDILSGIAPVAVEIGRPGEAPPARGERPRPRRFSSAASMALLRDQLRGWRRQPLMLVETLVLPIVLVVGLWLALPDRGSAWVLLVSLVLATALAAAFQVSRRPSRLLRTAQRHLLLNDALLAVFLAALLIAAVQALLGLFLIAWLPDAELSATLPLAAAFVAVAGTALGLACGVAAGQRSDLALALVAALGTIIIVFDGLVGQGSGIGLALSLLNPLPWAEKLAADPFAGMRWVGAGSVLLAQGAALLLAARYLLGRRL